MSISAGAVAAVGLSAQAVSLFQIKTSVLPVKVPRARSARAARDDALRPEPR
jgi:hypothetical protein